jgi:raffinose/stachyose/melibiose transport system substrate-binding protein
VDPRTTSRRSFLSLAIGAPLAATALAACGSDGPSGSGGGGGAAKTVGNYWYLSVDPQETIRRNSVDRFNKANPETGLKGEAFQNDAYKEKIKAAIGAGQAPTVIFGWGGGGLESYVKAGQVEDLTSWFDENSAVKDKLFEASFAAATVDGKIYAMPAEVVQPLFIFYDKRSFEKAGVDVPQSWEDIKASIPKFKAAGIAPFSLGGQSRWTNMMWLEFMFDRLGGTKVFDAVYAGTPNAWSDPTALKALTEIQDFVKAGGFVEGFSSITADSNADQALLFTGKAAMMLHGAWTYGSMKEQGGDFVSGGHIGYINFPPVEGGTGDPSATYGNPGQYYSISSKATPEAKEAAKKFFATQVLSEEEQKEWISAGQVPIVNGSDKLFEGSPDKEYLDFVYGIASNASTFSQSWDQALSPATAEVLLDNIAKLFQLQISPQQWIDNMNATIGK